MALYDKDGGIIITDCGVARDKFDMFKNDYYIIPVKRMMSYDAAVRSAYDEVISRTHDPKIKYADLPPNIDKTQGIAISARVAILERKAVEMTDRIDAQSEKLAHAHASSISYNERICALESMHDEEKGALYFKIIGTNN